MKRILYAFGCFVLLVNVAGQCNTTGKDGEVIKDYVFPIHFVVAVPSSTTTITESMLKAEVDTLNKYFGEENSGYSNNRKPIVTFEYKSFTSYSEVRKMKSGLLDVLNLSVYQPDSAEIFNAFFNREENRGLKDPNAINVYIYDCYSDNDSYGKYNSGKPWAWIDYARLGHVDAAIEHEFGHCFRLGHYCAPDGATSSTDTNIMSTAGQAPASGCVNSSSGKVDCEGNHQGNRSIGFDACQTNQIENAAATIHNELGM